MAGEITNTRVEPIMFNVSHGQMSTWTNSLLSIYVYNHSSRMLSNPYSFLMIGLGDKYFIFEEFSYDTIINKNKLFSLH